MEKLALRTRHWRREPVHEDGSDPKPKEDDRIVIASGRGRRPDGSGTPELVSVKNPVTSRCLSDCLWAKKGFPIWSLGLDKVHQPALISAHPFMFFSPIHWVRRKQILTSCQKTGLRINEPLSFFANLNLRRPRLPLIPTLCSSSLSIPDHILFSGWPTIESPNLWYVATPFHMSTIKITIIFLRIFTFNNSQSIHSANHTMIAPQKRWENSERV